MPPTAVQLYSLRVEMDADAVGTLKKVAEMGYKGVEPAGFAGMAPVEFRKVVEDLGMTICSAHGPGVTLDNFNEAVDTLKSLGLDSSSHMGFGGGASLDEVQAEADNINAVCDKLAEVGMTLFMHNHDGEFSTKFDGRTLFDVVFELCPKLLSEMDVYWTQVGGVDAVAAVRQYADRLPLMHIKDGMIDPASPMMALGTGKLDIAGCLAAADPAVLKWAIVELDEVAGDMTQAIADSCQFLTSSGLAEGTK